MTFTEYALLAGALWSIAVVGLEAVFPLMTLAFIYSVASKFI